MEGNDRRFNTDHTYVWNYGDRFLVECPKCRKCARVMAMEKNGAPEVRLSCTHCGKAKTWERKSAGVAYSRNADVFAEGEVWIGAAVDWYFHLPLWLRTPCCGNVLWAYNTSHLDWLKSFVTAGLRERQQNEKHGWSSRSLAGRLPKWLKQAGNREAVLSAIAKLAEKGGND